jgi:hypothetical protein
MGSTGVIIRAVFQLAGQCPRHARTARVFGVARHDASTGFFCSARGNGATGLALVNPNSTAVDIKTELRDAEIRSWPKEV